MKKIIAILVILSGILHILMAVSFDNQTMFMQMIMGGIFYLLMGVSIWRGSNVALFMSMLLMLTAGIASSFSISDIGYPVNLLNYFIGLNILVVVLSILYFFTNKVRARTN